LCFCPAKNDMISIESDLKLCFFYLLVILSFLAIADPFCPLWKWWKCVLCLIIPPFCFNIKNMYIFPDENMMCFKRLAAYICNNASVYLMIVYMSKQNTWWYILSLFLFNWHSIVQIWLSWRQIKENGGSRTLVTPSFKGKIKCIIYMCPGSSSHIQTTQ
jgi:hypothetical protein